MIQSHYGMDLTRFALNKYLCVFEFSVPQKQFTTGKTSFGGEEVNALEKTNVGGANEIYGGH